MNSNGYFVNGFPARINVEKVMRPEQPAGLPAAEGGGLVEVDVGVLVRGPVAAPVDQEQRLGGVRQRDDQRGIAPHLLVRDVHALFAPTVTGSERPVGVEELLVEEGVGLLLPGP